MATEGSSNGVCCGLALVSLQRIGQRQIHQVLHRLLSIGIIHHFRIFFVDGELVDLGRAFGVLRPFCTSAIIWVEIVRETDEVVIQDTDLEV